MLPSQYSLAHHTPVGGISPLEYCKDFCFLQARIVSFENQENQKAYEI